jgi:hypothetical protein
VAKLPARTTGTAQAIYALHEQRKGAEAARGYLGWSQIGEPCTRALWYSFRWAESGETDGRVLRLFDTGHREEARLLQELKDCGMKVYDRDPTGGQFGVSSVGGHFRGHLDAIVEGLPEAPKTPHLVDVKTIKAKKFDELLKKGMRELYPKYWAQGHGYMGKMDLKRAAFIFVCKDDDRIRVERFEYDPAEFKKYEDRATFIVTSATPPARMSEDPAWFECKFCAYQPICHGVRAPQVNCRTCAHSTPRLDGDARWACEKYECDLPIENQRTGCADHRYIPVLLEKIGTPEGLDGSLVLYTMHDSAKTQFANGEPPDGFTSEEICASGGPAMLKDRRVRDLREEFPNARIVPPTVMTGTGFDDMDSDIPWN